MKNIYFDAMKSAVLQNNTSNTLSQVSDGVLGSKMRQAHALEKAKQARQSQQFDQIHYAKPRLKGADANMNKAGLARHSCSA